MEPYRILIVADEPLLTSSLERQLVRLGYQVSERGVPESESIQKDGTTRPDLVLMDLPLRGDPTPEESANRDRLGIPVVYLVPRDDPQALERARIMEPHAYVFPPCEERELRLVVEMALSRHRLERTLQEREQWFASTIQAQRMEAVGQLAAGIAHDFNNLLTIINGFSQLLLGSLPLESPARLPLDHISRAAERAATLTRQLLAFSRKQLVQPRLIDLNALVGELVTLVCRVIGPDVTLTADLAPDLGKVQADPNQVEQILLQLAANARDAMPLGGRLTITTTEVVLDESYCQVHAEVRPGRYALLAVTDTGHGMTPQTKAHVFEPFFTTKDVGKGPGLGLASVHGSVKQIGGHVEVQSELGRGTTLMVYLPLGRNTQATEARSLAQETVLLVEDDDAVRGLTRHLLQCQGYTVLEASYANEALAMAAQYPGRIDLLVTDVAMPGLSGCQLARRLKAARPETRVLFLSGYTEEGLPCRTAASGANFLQKPFSRLAFTNKVREVLDQQEA